MYTNPCHLEIAREVARMLHISEDEACSLVAEVPEAITQFQEGIGTASDAACHVVCMWAEENLNLALEIVDMKDDVGITVLS